MAAEPVALVPKGAASGLPDTCQPSEGAELSETVSAPDHQSPLSLAQAALAEDPTDPYLLLRTSLAALLEERPELSLRYQHRFSKRYPSFCGEDQLLRAVALAQQGRWPQAAQLVKQHGKNELLLAVWYLPSDSSLEGWFRRWLTKIENVQLRREGQLRAKGAVRHHPKEGHASKHPMDSLPQQTAQPAPETRYSLPAFEFAIPLSISLPEKLEGSATANAGGDLADFRLRYELTRLKSLQAFDELLCLSQLHDVDAYSYQIEAVRKVLKQFRGRVLLADEVGLGKTIEAGMVLKEYLLRGMAERVLILTPASLVKQWQEEIKVKFGISFATSYDSLFRKDAESFWAQPRVIASIAAARRPEQLTRLVMQAYDLVIVDEAHHLKNRATANWKLVDALQKRFLLLLSATPVQNNLVEIYNLLTLLKPGIFKTEKEFRANYMTAGQPRKPAKSERLRDLMRDVMIRNTRSAVDVRLPLRHAATIMLEPNEPEATCYEQLSGLVQEAHRAGPATRRLALRHLLAAAGSGPASAADAIGRFLGNNVMTEAWSRLLGAYEALDSGSKQIGLQQLLRRNPNEKKIVFVHHRATLAALQRLLDKQGMHFVVFEGAMSGPAKDRVIERFRDEVPILLSTESGGEGRNLQFCNTIINFDLPWNPMAIEQRIGRIHRIGQTRDVFVFNLVVRHTLEEQILRILDEKINMFELVVGEIGAILGQIDDDREFAEMVFAAWMETTVLERQAAFGTLGDRLAAAKNRYDSVKSLDAELFGDEFAAS
ncbi:MAG: SNF2-related protein [Acidobacteriota bacterium]|nr:SNF2-related protein [Acidobacteriota bacterium]